MHTYSPFSSTMTSRHKRANTIQITEVEELEETFLCTNLLILSHCKCLRFLAKRENWVVIS